MTDLLTPAKQFILDYLKGGPVTCRSLTTAGRQQNISTQIAKYARKELGVVTKELGTSWWAALPEHEDRLTEQHVSLPSFLR